MIRAVVTSFSVAALIAATVSGIASADTVTIQAQAGQRITTDGISWCTLGVVGTDSHGNKVALTAGHCDEAEGAPVYLCSNQDGDSIVSFVDMVCGEGPRIGVYANHGDGTEAYDWAAILLDPDVVELPDSVHGLAINHIDTTPAMWQTVRKDGQRTAFTSGLVTYMQPDGVFGATTIAWKGDSGSPATVNGGIVGLTDEFGLGNLHPDIDEFVPMSNIVADADSQGGVGAGFQVAR